MNHYRRTLLTALPGAALGLALAHRAQALNPQPEVPSKNQGKTNPKALNPQPEVPSKNKKKKKMKKTKTTEKKKVLQQP